MTRKSHAFTKLPLLGSNQDSPDPEALPSGLLAGMWANISARIAPENRRRTHRFTHRFSPRGVASFFAHFRRRVSEQPLPRTRQLTADEREVLRGYLRAEGIRLPEATKFYGVERHEAMQ